jgi:hypothetical protein
MENLIFDINDDIEKIKFNLSDPVLINNASYFSKITHGNNNKNFYIKLSKSFLKQNLKITKNKNICELIFSINEKKVINLFENLETFIINEIYKKKELWFYNSQELNIDDINDLMTPILRTYKSGQQFIIRCNYDCNKLKIYDDNEHNINIEDFKNNENIIPLVHINGIKFSTKNFVLDITIMQILVLNDSESIFSEKCLIKFNNTKKNSNEENKTEENENEENITEENEENNNEYNQNEITIDIDKNNMNNIEQMIHNNFLDTSNNDLNDNLNNDSNDNLNNNSNVNLNNDSNDNLNNDSNDNLNNNSNDNLNNDSNDNLNNEFTDASNNELIDVSNNELIETSPNKLIDVSNNELIDVLNNELIDVSNNESIDISNIDFDNYDLDENEELVNLTNENLNINNQSDEIFKIKTRDAIYLEIYKKARKKAKEIRNNAIAAFLEAKKIKIKYNLEDISDSDESDESDKNDL